MKYYDNKKRWRWNRYHLPKLKLESLIGFILDGNFVTNSWVLRLSASSFSTLHYPVWGSLYVICGCLYTCEHSEHILSFADYFMHFLCLFFASRRKKFPTKKKEGKWQWERGREKENMDDNANRSKRARNGALFVFNVHVKTLCTVRKLFNISYSSFRPGVCVLCTLHLDMFTIFC